MASNWNLLRRKYPLPEDPTYEQVKAAIRDKHKGMTLSALAEVRQEREDTKDRYDQIVQCLQAELTVLDELVYESLEKAEADSVKTSRGVTFRRDATIDAKVQADGGAEKLRAWLFEHDMKEYLTVNGNSLSKLVRDLIDADKELPEGVDAVPRHKLRVTGRATKGQTT